MKPCPSLIWPLICALFFWSSSAFCSSVIGLRWAGGMMNNYNFVWGGEIGVFHSGPLNCCSHNSPYGHDFRIGIYFDRYFNILDGTVFPKPLYRRIFIPLSYGPYVSLQGILERYKLVGYRRRMQCKQSWIDLRLGIAPSVYVQTLHSLNKNMLSLGLIPKENPVLRGVDIGVFLGVNANAELMISLPKMMSLSLRSQMDIFLQPIPVGQFSERALNADLPYLRTRAGMLLNKPVLPSFVLSFSVRFLHNQYRVVTRTKHKLFRKKRRIFK